MAKKTWTAEELAEAWIFDKGFDYTLSGLIDGFDVTKPEAYAVSRVIDRRKAEEQGLTEEPISLVSDTPAPIWNFPEVSELDMRAFKRLLGAKLPSLINNGKKRRKR